MCQAEGIGEIIVSDLTSGSVPDVNDNKFENNKNSTFKHFLPSGVWMVRHMISDFCISVGVTLLCKLKLYLKHNSKCAIHNAEIVKFGLRRLKIMWFSQVFGPTVPIMQALGLHGGCS